MAACVPAPLHTPQVPTPPATLSPEVVGDPVALVTAERNAASARDLATLAQLWVEDATIVEMRGPGEGDDYRWQGRDALLDRYEVAVFPNPPPPLDAPLELTPDILGDTATLVNGVDRWTFERRGGRWWITSLEIGVPE